MKKIPVTFKIKPVDILIALAVLLAFGIAGYISNQQAWQMVKVL